MVYWSLSRSSLDRSWNDVLIREQLTRCAVIQPSDPMSRAFRRLPWWLRLGFAYLAIAAMLGVLVACLALVFCALFGRCEQSLTMLGCTAGLFALPLSAIAGTRLWHEIRYALDDPDRPAVRAREQEALAHILSRYREAPPD
jgi:hypothetical protein